MAQRILAYLVLSLLLAGCAGRATPQKDKQLKMEPDAEDRGKHLPISADTLVYDSTSLAQWIKQLKEGKPEERAGAARAIGKFRSPKVKTETGKEDYLSREESGIARREVAKAVPLLVEACRQPDNQLLKRRACAALLEIGEANKIPLEGLIALLADESAGVRPDSAGFHPFEGHDLSFVNLCQIAKELKDRGAMARVAAPLCEVIFQELGNQKCDNGKPLKANARDLAMPPLPIEAFLCYDLGVDHEATGSRWEPDLQRAQEAVRPFGTLVVVLLEDLTKFLDKCRAEELAAFAEAIEDPDPSMRFAATLGIIKLGTTAKGLGPKVRKLLDEKSPRVRLHAAVALLAIEVRADPAILPAVRKALADNSALRSGFQTKRLVPILINVSDEAKSSELRALTAELLGDLGPVASEAIPMLIGMRGDANVQVRKAAAAALKKIQPDK